MKTLSYFLPLIFSLSALNATEKEDITTIVNKWVRESRPKNQWPNELSGIINKYSDIEKEDDLDRLIKKKAELIEGKKIALELDRHSNSYHTEKLDVEIGILKKKIRGIETDRKKELDSIYDNE